MRNLIVVLLLVCSPAAVGALKPKPGKAPKPTRAQADFIVACEKAFEERSPELGKKICECAADESRHQKVTEARLKAETAKIAADPTYQIQDKGLLASLHYCTFELMHQHED